MRRRSLTTALMAAFAAFSAPAADASAQAMVHVAGGASVPVGDYGGFADTGLLGHAGVAFPVGGGGFGIGAAGYFGRNGHTDVGGDATNLYGGLGFVNYAFGTRDAVSPFVVAMAGLMVHDYTSELFPEFEVSNTGFALGGGAGVAFPLGGVSGFVEAWLLNGFFTDGGGGDGSNTTVVGVDVGVQLSVRVGR